MNIVFRTDASLQIGTGHVMRCLTLADELCERGAEISFICREHPGNLIGLIEGKGYSVKRLPQPTSEYLVTSEDVAHAAWLGVPWQQDATETLAALGETQQEWLIVDHYALDRRWESILRPRVGKIMVIDDLADRPHDCDLLLDQNLYQDMETRYDKLIPTACAKLLGPKYALLRPEFAQARKKLCQRDGQVRRILVFFGGVDPTNETEKAIHALTSIADRQFTVDVVVGSGNPHKQQIENLCAGHEGFHYHCQVDNMAELMAAADLAIGAGGTATWERCAVGLAAIVISLAENQINIASSADKAGVLLYLGESPNISIHNLYQKLVTIIAADNCVSFLSKNAWHLVDGSGVCQIANIVD